MTQKDQMENDPVDQAIHRRLSSLRNMPVDVSRLAKSIGQAIPRQPTRKNRLVGWMRPFRVAAASIALLALAVALLIAVSTGPVLASPDRMADIYTKSMEGAQRVSSISEANAKLKLQSQRAPELPTVEAEAVRACCLHHLDKKQLACVTLEIDQAPVTLVVADAQDVKCPHAQMVTRDGIKYCVMSSGKLNIIMWENGSRWASLVSTLPADRLIDAATKIRF
jgi:hypothetical protein